MKPDLIFHCRSITMRGAPRLILSGNAILFYVDGQKLGNLTEEQNERGIPIWASYAKDPQWLPSFVAVFSDYQQRAFSL